MQVSFAFKRNILPLWIFLYSFYNPIKFVICCSSKNIKVNVSKLRNYLRAIAKCNTLVEAHANVHHKIELEIINMQLILSFLCTSLLALSQTFQFLKQK